ncbi:MAG TPA: KH domain-containing protein [Acidimicrobiales bacterium]|nr:KH domain-containing protein [Acidimicrobiales bacterium]
MTDLYEAGDINQVGGGGSAGADDEYDDDIDDTDDIEDLDDGDDLEDVDVDDDDVDDVDEVAGEGNQVGVGNERTAFDGGTPLSVLTYLAKSLSNDPEAVVIDTEERRNGLRLNLHVAPEDMGRVIGRRGRTAQAIRTMINVAGAKDGVQASVDIVDD